MRSAGCSLTRISSVRAVSAIQPSPSATIRPSSLRHSRYSSVWEIIAAVHPQANVDVVPKAMPGTPGSVSPTARSPGASIDASLEIDGFV